jgi:hypothetical protein
MGMAKTWIPTSILFSSLPTDLHFDFLLSCIPLHLLYRVGVVVSLTLTSLYQLKFGPLIHSLKDLKPLFLECFFPAESSFFRRESGKDRFSINTY